MGTLTFHCPRTGRPIESGIETDAATMMETASVPVRLICPHCLREIPRCAGYLNLRWVPCSRMRRPAPADAARKPGARAARESQDVAWQEQWMAHCETGARNVPRPLGDVATALCRRYAQMHPPGSAGTAPATELG